MPKPVEYSRRSVLRLMWVGVIAACALSIEPIIKYLTSQEDRIRSPLVVYNQPLNDLSEWQKITNTRVWVKRDTLGIMALVATCTHLGCEVNFDIQKKEWHCPCHNSIYNDEGRPISGPALKDLHRVSVARNPNGSLTINTSKQVGMDTRV